MESWRREAGGGGPAEEMSTIIAILEMKVQLDPSKNISWEKLHFYFQRKRLLIKYGCRCLCWVLHNWFLCSLPDRAIFGSHVFSERDFDTKHTHTSTHTHPPTMAPSNHQQRLINRLPQALFLFGFYSLNTCWASIVSNDYSFFSGYEPGERTCSLRFSVFTK